MMHLKRLARQIAVALVLAGLLWYLKHVLLSTTVANEHYARKPTDRRISKTTEHSARNTIQYTSSKSKAHRLDAPSNFTRQNEYNNRSSAIAHSGRILKPIKMGFGPIYIYGAVAGNSSADVAWDIIKLYGIVNNSVFNSKYMFKNTVCCLKYNNKNGFDTVRNPLLKATPCLNAELRCYHFACANTLHTTGRVPVLVGLATKQFSCGNNYVTYIRPYLPLQLPGTTLAIGTKVAFGNVSSELILEWMETYKYLGVDKVVTYYSSNITLNALRVLIYYASTGLLDLIYYELVTAESHPREFTMKNLHQAWNDKQLVVHDSYEMMSGYTYFGIIDHDEFLIPSKSRSLKQLLADLGRKYKTAGAFVFQSQYTYLSWGVSSNFSDLILGSYVNVTTFGPKLDNMKSINKNKYVSIGGISTHNTEPMEGYERAVVPAREGFIHHFRHCRRNSSKCLYSTKRATDMSVAEWSAVIQDNVIGVRRRVFGTDKPIS